jgi:hypothetical protein
VLVYVCMYWPGQVMKDEYKRRGCPLHGKNRQTVLAEVQKQLNEKKEVEKKRGVAHNKIVSTEHGTYITGNAPSQYLPFSETAYAIKLDGNTGRQYVTNGKDFSKWVSDYFPDTALL